MVAPWLTDKTLESPLFSSAEEIRSRDQIAMSRDRIALQPNFTRPKFTRPKFTRPKFTRPKFTRPQSALLKFNEER